MNRFHHLFASVAILVGPASIVSADDNRHSSLLRQAEASAAEFRSLPAGDEAKEKLRTQVQSLVEKSFDARQIAQREQIEQMRQKLREA